MKKFFGLAKRFPIVTAVLIIAVLAIGAERADFFHINLKGDILGENMALKAKVISLSNSRATEIFYVDSSGNVSTPGTLTVTGGVVVNSATPIIWAAGGATALATTGTDVACSNGGRWWVEVNIPYNVTLTGIAYLIGSVGGTDSVVVQLCNSTGVQVATSRAVGGAAAIVGTAANIQSVPFTATYSAVAGKYFAVLQFNGTTAKFRAYPIPGSKFIGNGTTGTWQTKADITPGTTFVADKAPICMTY